MSDEIKRKRGRPAKDKGTAIAPNMTLVAKEGELILNIKPKKGRPPKAYNRKSANTTFRVTDDVLQKAEHLAARGLTYAQIANYFGVSYQTMLNIRKADEMLNLAIEKGKSHGIEQVAGTLYEKAIAGDTIAAIFYLKAIAGWRETSNVALAATVHMTFDKADASA